MFSNSKTNLIEKLKAAWGKPKDDAFNFELIEEYWKKTDKSSALQAVSSQTMNDLDFYGLFEFADRTHSKIGQQYLFNKLLTINPSPDFTQQEKLVDHVTLHENDRIKAQIILSKLGDTKVFHISSLFLDEFVKPPESYSVMKPLSIMTLATVAAAFFLPTLWIAACCLAIANMALHYANKKYIHRYSDSIPQISPLSAACRELLKMNLPVSHPGTVASSIKSIDRIKGRLSVFALESKQQSDVFMQLAFFIVEYVKIAFLLEPIIVFGVLRHLREKRTDIRNLFEFIGTVDGAISIASLRHGLGRHCKPQISPRGAGFGFIDLYHPLIPDCVPNTLTVQDKSILLTGSNMSGKSTFIRSVSINALFAQTVNTCFASDFHLPPLKIRSAMRISDDVFSGKSYYFEEVLLVKEMIGESRAGRETLFLLDEIFKGTNTIERIAAGKAVLSYICKKGNIVFVSTHDIELAGLLQNTYDLYHFSETVDEGRVQFDYQLKRGELKTRNAIRILEINGYPEEVIAEAKEISNRIME